MNYYIICLYVARVNLRKQNIRNIYPCAPCYLRKSFSLKPRPICHTRGIAMRHYHSPFQLQVNMQAAYSILLNSKIEVPPTL